MSRTVLLSEIEQVIERYPESITGLRGLLIRAGASTLSAEAVPALAERLHTRAEFRVELHAGLQEVCRAEPEISQLELLGVLVVAVAGRQVAAGLSVDPGMAGPLRRLFNTVLEFRRWQRDGSSEVSAPAPDEFSHSVPPSERMHTQPDTRVELLEERPWRAGQEQEPVIPAAEMDRSAMLSRALALAATEEVEEPGAKPEVVSPAPAPLAASAVEELPAAMPAPRSDRYSEPAVPARMFTEPVSASSEAEAEDEEEPVLPRRRWGMWTAAACGVLAGFGLGVFLHFDHGAASGPRRLAASGQVQEATSSGHAKSIGELQAEIAALDTLANADPAAADRISKEKRPVPDREASRSIDSPRRPVHGIARSTQDREPVLEVRASQATVVASNRPPAAAAPIATTASTPVAIIRPVSLTSAGASFSGAPREAALPRVTTGSAGIMAANLVSSPAPAYPVAASTAGVQGEVVVEAVVGRDGEVVGTRIVSGPVLLRAAALAAVQHWHYRPYEVDGKPIEVATTARLEFRLDQ